MEAWGPASIGLPALGHGKWGCTVGPGRLPPECPRATEGQGVYELRARGLRGRTRGLHLLTLSRGWGALGGGGREL